MGRRELNLTKDALALLMERLDENHERADQEYRKLWRKLVTILRHRGCLDPEDQASEVIVRVVEKLGQVQITNLGGFVLGVARNVALEKHRAPATVPIDDVPEPATQDRDEDQEEEEKALACLEDCLERLPRQDRELILEFYGYEKDARIDTRKRLAKGLGGSVGALRVRAFRIRQQLEHCVTECMKWNRYSVT
jgi:RNA polymerase sigma factor (sigma-70 family)